MSRNGVGVYSLPATSWNPAVSGATIESSAANTTLLDIAAALTQSISRDGQTLWQGDDDHGGNKIVNVAPGVASTDVATVGQIPGTLSGVYAVLSGNNIFAGNQTINGGLSLSGSMTATNTIGITKSGAGLIMTSAIAGTIAQFNQVDSGAAAGPLFSKTRLSATAVAGDVLGGINYNGSNTTPNSTIKYAGFQTVINNTASGAEAGQFEIYTRVGGVDTRGLRVASGVVVGAASGGDMGLGTINTKGVYVNGTSVTTTGTTRYYGSYAANTGLTTVLPLDDTIPTSSEGTQVITVNVTTTSVTQRVRARFVAFGNSGAGVGTLVAALFRDTTFLNASTATTNAAAWAVPIAIEVEEVPGSASTFAYSVRVGPGSAGTAVLNGNGSGRFFGGSAVATLVIDVWEP